MTNKPNLIKIGEGKWVHPAYITNVEDGRFNGIGNVIIGTVGGSLIFACHGDHDEAAHAEANDALKAIGLGKDDV